MLLKLSFNFKKLLECLVLGQFVVQQLVTVRFYFLNSAVFLCWVKRFVPGLGL